MVELQVISGLQDKRSELIGLVGRLEQQLAEHRGNLTHLDATMRLFDPDLLLQDAEPKQRERISWFRHGECLRVIYDVLREATQPLTSREIAQGDLLIAPSSQDVEPPANPARFSGSLGCASISVLPRHDCLTVGPTRRSGRGPAFPNRIRTPP